MAFTGQETMFEKLRTFIVGAANGSADQKNNQGLYSEVWDKVAEYESNGKRRSEALVRAVKRVLFTDKGVVYLADWVQTNPPAKIDVDHA